MSPTPDSSLPAGTRMAHFEIRREIGVGAMGTVYEAWDTSLDRAVAVKVLRDRIAHEPGVVERFFREARAAARVNHPNLTHIYYVGREGDRPFFAMEFVPGSNLEKLVAERGPLPVGEAVDLLVQAARGLAAAHAGGVIHRDVKPSNLIRRDDGTLKVADFGLAKSMDADVGATGGGSLMGTPTFMSPEQCRGRTADARADVYALGLVAWFVLAGKPPFASQSLGELLNDQINTPLPSACAARPELPPAADDVLTRLCAKDPAERPGTMEEVARLLETLRPRRLALAPIFARGAAHVMDGSLAAGAAATAWVLVAGLRALVGELLPMLPRETMDSAVFRVLGLLLVTGVGVGVLLAPEIWYRTSLGKYLFELKVVRADGTRPAAVALVGRLLLRFPGFAILPLPFVGAANIVTLGVCALLQVIAAVSALVIYFTRDGLTLSDVVTRTRVVYRRSVA